MADLKMALIWAIYPVHRSYHGHTHVAMSVVSVSLTRTRVCIPGHLWISLRNDADINTAVLIVMYAASGDLRL